MEVLQTEVREVASLDFHRRRENLIMIGATGSGKMHPAIALRKKLRGEGVKVHFYRGRVKYKKELGSERPLQ